MFETNPEGRRGYPKLRWKDELVEDFIMLAVNTSWKAGALNRLLSIIIKYIRYTTDKVRIHRLRRLGHLPRINESNISLLYCYHLFLFERIAEGSRWKDDLVLIYNKTEESYPFIYSVFQY